MFYSLQGSNYNGCASEFDSNGICWPTTLANYSVTVPCSPNPLNFDNDQRGNAFGTSLRLYMSREKIFELNKMRFRRFKKASKMGQIGLKKGFWHENLTKRSMGLIKNLKNPKKKLI